MKRRIFGLETEYGIAFDSPVGRGLSPDHIARYLFRRVVAWGRSSSVFLRNGGRFYLDVGSHPEYATAECDDVAHLVAQDRAGELIMEGALEDAMARLSLEGIGGQIHLFKNNLDSEGNSYGCHENYLVSRTGDFTRFTDLLMPMLATRHLIAGAGHIVTDTRGRSRYAFSQRAGQISQTLSSATTRTRPIINSRDEPHADAERFRRLHVIVGDSNMADTTTMLKVGATDLVIRMIEEGVPLHDLRIADPIAAMRASSADMTGTTPFTLMGGHESCALKTQWTLWERARRFADGEEPSVITVRILDLWRRCLQAIDSGLWSDVEREIDWAIKWRLIERYQARSGAPLDDPRVARLTLAYHDVSRADGVFGRLRRRGLVESLVSDIDAIEATVVPPQTTRAKLRGDFVRVAERKRRDYTVDWVHLKVSDGRKEAVLCKDPFVSQDERVQQLIDSM